MCLPLREVVEPALKRLEPAIVDIYRGSWEDWKADPRCGVYLYKRTRADLMHEHAVRRALAAFTGVRGVRPLPGQETCHFICDDRVLFRFKKGDDDGRTSNIQTELALAYHDPQATLFDLPDVHRVDVAYVLSPLQTDLAKIFVVGRDQDRILWRYDVLGRAGEFGDITPLPTRPLPPRQSLVKPREATLVPFPGNPKASDVD
jgi:hypothetical protein